MELLIVIIKFIYILLFNNLFVVISLFVGFGWTLALVDCCEPSHKCVNNLTHVACNPTMGFSPNCIDATEIELDWPRQNMILHEINLLRSQVAVGNLAGFPTASNMLELVRIYHLLDLKEVRTVIIKMIY